MEYLAGIVMVKFLTEIWPNFGMICVAGCAQ
jgi:hypothetical protein